MKQALRSIFSALLAAACLSAAGGAGVFALSAVPAETALETLRTLEILEGDGSGDLRLEEAVTRAQFAKLLAAASSYRDEIASGGAGYSLYFDVKSAHWASEYIRLAAQEGWMTGYADGTFRPEASITLEEACTAALRLLGYNTSDLPGTFPYAQLNKAEALGLRKGLGLERGEVMTRGDCVRLLYNVLVAKDQAGQVYAVTLGYTVTDGVVDFDSVIREGIAGPFTAKTGTALPFTPRSIYRNGVRAESGQLQRNDVYYYHEGAGTLWIYTERVSGKLTALRYRNGVPSSVTVGGTEYTVDPGGGGTLFTALRDTQKGQIVTLLLGMDGAAADISVCAGPFVATNGDRLPFRPDTVYRNGARSASSALMEYDIYYYDTSLGTAWIYTKRVSGKLESVLPQNGRPETVVLDGTQYPICSEAVSKQLEARGENAINSYVTLLLGVDGEVAGLLTGDEVNGIFYGVLQSWTKQAAEDTAAVYTRVTVLCMDGVTRTFTIPRERDYSIGSVVQVTAKQGVLDITTAPTLRLEGRFSEDGRTFGEIPLARDVQILDAGVHGAAALLRPERLAGVTLRQEDVRYYTRNSAGEIDNLILDNATGDAWTYAYLFACDVETSSSGSYLANTVANYSYLVDGEVTTIANTSWVYPVTAGGIALVQDRNDGSLRSMRQLGAVTLDALSGTAAHAGARSYPIADNVQVYLWKNFSYYLTDLTAVDIHDCELTGWYDTFSGPAGRQIRIILAKPLEEAS